MLRNWKVQVDRKYNLNCIKVLYLIYYIYVETRGTKYILTIN